MIKHIVWWTLKPEADGRSAAENAKRIMEMGNALAGKIPGLVSIELSANIQASSSVPASLALQSVHNSVKELQEYAVHPLHLAVVEVIKLCTDSRQCLDYEI